MVPGLVLGVGILFLPFSPRWLVSKSRDFEAGQSLSKLRQLDISDSRVQQEWIDIRAEVGRSLGAPTVFRTHILELRYTTGLRRRLVLQLDAYPRLKTLTLNLKIAFHKEVSAERHPKLQDGSNVSRVKLEIFSWADCMLPPGIFSFFCPGFLISEFEVAQQTWYEC